MSIILSFGAPHLTMTVLIVSRFTLQSSQGQVLQLRSMNEVLGAQFWEDILFIVIWNIPWHSSLDSWMVPKHSYDQSWLPTWMAPGQCWLTQKPVQSIIIYSEASAKSKVDSSGKNHISDCSWSHASSVGNLPNLAYWPKMYHLHTFDYGFLIPHLLFLLHMPQSSLTHGDIVTL